MSLGQTGSDFRLPLRGKKLQSGATLGGSYSYVNLFDSSGNSVALLPATDALTALAGGAQAGTALVAGINRFTTVASAADSAQLPVSTPGTVVIVINAAAANAMAVFGQTGDAINAIAANSAFSLAANKTAIFFCAVAGTWNSVLTA